MNKNFTEKLTNYSVSIENLTQIIDIAADMVSQATWGSVSEDKEKLEEHMGRLVAFMDSISEIAHKRNDECEILIQMLSK